jgi:predicted CXXCH cytochrome family protein
VTQAELIAPERELCSACHAKTLELRTPWRTRRRAGADAEVAKVEITEHGPIREGSCAPCHPAHPKKASDLLYGTLPTGRYVAYERAAYSACTGSCHPPALIEDERTSSATRFRNGSDNLHYRHVVRPRAGRSCRFCHDPHLADNPALVRRGLPFGKQVLTLDFEVTERGGRCTTSCHIPTEYDRDEAVPSSMRVREPAALEELR